MPLLSGSASGKLANAMVFFPWKGIAVVRKWLIPTNKMSSDQGDQRIMLGGSGRACGTIYPNTGHTTVSAFAQQLIDLGLIPSGQTKQSFLVQYILSHYITDSTSYAAELAELTDHTAYSGFLAAADSLGIVDFDIDYTAVDPYDRGLGLYLIAKAAIANGFTGTPYTLALTAWTNASITLMISDFTNEAA